MTRLAVSRTPLLMIEEEVEFLADTLAPSFGERNKRWLNRRAPEAAIAKVLAARGYVDLGPTVIVDTCWIVSVTVAGARAMVAAGAVTIAQLATDVDRMLGRLVAYRRCIQQGLADASICDGWDAFPDEPFSRVASAILLKRKHVEQREARSHQETRALPGHLFLRATDLGMAAG